jgi:hypothetical protein
MSEDQSKQRDLAIRIARGASDAQRIALAAWAHELLEIRASNLSTFKKGKRALEATLQTKVVWPAAKIAAQEIKRLTWDERGYKGRWGLLGALTGLLIFGGQGAGIAALGTAIGVPLWVVLGAGAAFAAGLYEEITSKKSNTSNTDKTTYRVIDADREDKE